eukprot:CAMPEP_0195067722 /NCGR_PEP_ID=MMETSP0448-20130528/12695_1 /TAXON_ID=66468 /ORGANISM="Heterocapsa triquestra, Strain CCMP 448" /LENGTH=486 /DNA_ID=CAMNT_0040099169 /DNA_START=14 /DNA_END=1474 /DNA_ORIENTATION=-
MAPATPPMRRRERGDERPASMLKVLTMVIPVTATYILEGTGGFIPLWAAGHYGDTDDGQAAHRVSALGLGTMAIIMVANIMRAGWSGGQDSLVSQAFGAGDFARARTHLHQCQLWMTLLSAVASFLLCFGTERALLALGCADEEMAAMTSAFVIGCVPGLFFEYQYDTLRKFLLNQEISTPSLCVVGITAPLHVLVVHLLMTYTSLDRMLCLGMSVSVKSTAAFLLLAAYTTIRRPWPSCDGWWWPFEPEALSYEGLLEFARYGLPSVLMYSCDWMAWEILTLFAGGLRDGPEMAAHVASAGAQEWLYLSMSGAPKVATVLVGNAAGKGNQRDVRHAMRTCAIVDVALSLATVAGIYAFREQAVQWLLPGAPEAQECLSSLMHFVALEHLLDAGSSQLFQGIFAGLGWQGEVATGSFICCWPVQLPLAYYLAYNCGMGVWGLRAASIVASLMCNTYCCTLLRRYLAEHEVDDELLPMAAYAALKTA